MTDTAATNTPRLVAGCHLYPGADGTWRYYLPGDEFVRISAPQAVLRAAQQRLHGVPGGDTAPGNVTGLDVEIELFLAALRERHVLQDVPEPWSTSPGPRVHLLDDTPVARQVAELLGDTTYPEHALITAGPLGADAADADVLVSCAGWLPDARWQALDSWCRAHRVAWHMSYLEGTRWYLGPMAVPGLTAGYRDTRARRLGASGAPEELRAYWAYLDSAADSGGAEATPVVPWPDRAGCAVLAGLLVTDILSHHRTGSPAFGGHQVEVDLQSLSLTRHPVLPLPSIAGTA